MLFTKPEVHNVLQQHQRRIIYGHRQHAHGDDSYVAVSIQA